jgi:hypothetical protein
MQKNSALTWLVPLIALIAIITAGVGLFSQGGDGAYTFTTLHSQNVEIYGKGLYQNDSRLVGSGFRGVDAVTLFISIPLLVVSFLFYRRGNQNAHLLMIAALFYFLYNAGSMSFAASFNTMFPFYIAQFSASLFATILALTSFDRQTLANRVQPGFPHRGMAVFLFIAGAGTLMLWWSELIGPLMSGQAPALLGPYTTLYTHGFDSAVITPAAILTGLFLLRREPLGYLLAAPIMVFCTLVGIVVIAQTISQTLEGIIFPIGVYIGMIGSWIVMGAFAIGLTVAYFRNLSKTM